MGLDVRILFRVRPNFDPTESDVFEGNHIVGFDVQDIPDYLKEDNPEATHELDTSYRYYGIGYERGPWPYICGALMILLASKKVDKVWYGSDCGDVHEIDAETILEICSHYMKNGHRPYRDFFK